MARREKSLLRLDAVRVEGAIIQPDIVAAAANAASEQQKPENYGLDRGLVLRDEIGRAYIIAKGQWATYLEGIGGRSPGAVRHKLATGILERVLGFALGTKRTYPARGGANADIDLYQVADGRLPVAIGAGEDIDHVETLEITGSDPIRRSATTLVQGDLNARDGALWGIATNGLTWRLLRDNESITRPGYVEINLERIFRDDLYSDFTAFWLLAHRSRFPQDGAANSDCALEQWRQIGREKGVTVRSELRDGVQKALFHFGRGFLENPANTALVARLNAEGDARLTREDFFRQLLRMVYRLIFVMTAEDREILHPEGVSDVAKSAYADGYGTGRLRERARNRIAWDRHWDAFEGIKALFKSLRTGEPKLGLPALGGLFAAEQTPDLDGAQLTNKRFLNGLYSLSWLRRDGALSRINWRDMETEEFGSVYESLLELTPEITDGGKKFSFVGQPDEDNIATQGAASGKNAKGNERKTTGSYYTPDSLVQLLLKEALDPVIDRKVAENPGDPEALLTLKVIDPACGSGHFILAAARKIARRLADLRHAGSPTVAQYRHALRDVARRCIYGVDRNPMAVELCRVAIWVETVEPGKPLTFMDQKIRCGDSLVGVFDFACLAKGIPDEAYAPLSGDDKAAAAHYRKLNALQRDPKDARQRAFSFIEPPAELVNKAKEIEALPEDDLEQIALKRQMFDDMQKSGWINQKRACDLWTAAFFIPKKNVPPSRGLYEVPLTDNVWTAWAGTLPAEPLQKAVDKAAKDGAFLHWPLIFADVMKEGGFDCVVGNPPWERVKIQEQEFFASRIPEISTAPNKAVRDRLLKALAAADIGSAEHSVWSAYTSAKRDAEAVGEYVRLPHENGGRFPLSGRGDVNTYALFSELFVRLTIPSGKSGIIVPTGIATDATTSVFFGSIIQQQKLSCLYSFENEALIFPSVHHAFKFCIMVITGNVSEKANFAFYIRHLEQLSQSERNFSLTAAEIAEINPNTKTAPVFRSRADAELTAKIYAATSVLIDESREAPYNPWGAFYLRLVHYGDHSEKLYDREKAAREGFQQSGFTWSKNGANLLPVYESKYVNLLDHRYSSAADSGDAITIDKSTITSEINPRYWVEEYFFEQLMNKYNYGRKWLLGYRDIARSNDARTLISMALPRMPASVNLPTLGFKDSNPGHALLANFSSLVLDFVVRQNISGAHLTFGVLKQIPVFGPDFYNIERLSFITPRILELTYTSSALAPFARELGYNGSPFAWNEDRRAVLRAELDAFYAKAYGLTRDELRYVLDPADVRGADYPSETFRVLKNNEMAKHGEYRTRRLVLEAWDRQNAKQRAA